MASRKKPNPTQCQFCSENFDTEKEMLIHMEDCDEMEDGNNE